MLKGATGKRFFYFLSAFLRFIVFLGLVVAYIVVKITVKPPISWLNILLVCLMLSNLITSLFNLVLCGFSANQYRDNRVVQFICFLLTLLTGGIATSTITGVAVFTKVLPEEIKNEKIFNVKKFNINGDSDEKKTKN